MRRYSRASSSRWAALVVWGLTGAGAAIAPRVACADEQISEEARRHFKAGVAFLQDPDGERPEEAYTEFKVAYALSKSPKVLGNLALCAMKLERDGEAIDAYKRYVMEVSDIDDDERRQVNSDIAMLTASAVRVTVTVDSPQTRFIDTRIPVRGAPITNVYGPVDDKLEIVMRVGHHRLQAKSGSADAEWEFDATGDTQMTHDFHLQSAPAPGVDRPVEGTSRSKTAPIVTMSIGAAMLLTSAVTGFVALTKVNDLVRACPHDECPAGFDYAGARTSARTFVGLTDILLLSGALLTGGGAAWFFLQGESSKPGPAPSTRTSASCTSEGCGATFRFDFQ